jgi:hypothetical protein
MIGRTLALYRMVSADELKEFVAEIGGQWYIWESGGCKGIIEDAGAYVWPFPPYPLGEYCFEPDDMEILRAYTAQEVVCILEIDISHNEGSQQLASRVVEMMLRRWGGIEIDDEWSRAPGDQDWW